MVLMLQSGCLLGRIGLAVLLVALLGCSEAQRQPKSQAPLSMGSLQAADEPCWIRAPDCMAAEEPSYHFITGQSDRAYASFGRPSRAAFDAARNDAEIQYARYLGVQIRSELNTEQRVSTMGAETHFDQVVQASVKREVSDLVKADEYYVANSSDESGRPLWVAYVLLKVEKSAVEKHRQSVWGAVQTQRQPTEVTSRKVVMPVSTPVFSGRPQRIESSVMTVATSLPSSIEEGLDLTALIDGNDRTFWQLRRYLLKPMVVEVSFEQPVYLTSMEFDRPSWAGSRTYIKAFNLKCQLQGGGWLPDEAFEMPLDSGPYEVAYEFQGPISKVVVSLHSNYGNHEFSIGDIGFRGYVSDRQFESE